MKTDELLFWAAYAIPFILILVSASADKLIGKTPWHWKHFYCGVDLMIAVLCAALLNVLDLAKLTDAGKRMEGLIWTVLFVAASIFLLFAVSGFHQDWGAEDRYGRGQILLLGVASNGVGIALACWFVQLKAKGLL